MKVNSNSIISLKTSQILLTMSVKNVLFVIDFFCIKCVLFLYVMDLNGKKTKSSINNKKESTMKYFNSQLDLSNFQARFLIWEFLSHFHMFKVYKFLLSQEKKTKYFSKCFVTKLANVPIIRLEITHKNCDLCLSMEHLSPVFILLFCNSLFKWRFRLFGPGQGLKSKAVPLWAKNVGGASEESF